MADSESECKSSVRFRPPLAFQLSATAIILKWSKICEWRNAVMSTPTVSVRWTAIWV